MRRYDFVISVRDCYYDITTVNYLSVNPLQAVIQANAIFVLIFAFVAILAVLFAMKPAAPVVSHPPRPPGPGGRPGGPGRNSSASSFFKGRDYRSANHSYNALIFQYFP